MGVFSFFLVLIYCARVLKLMLHITFLWGVTDGNIRVAGRFLRQRRQKWWTVFCWGGWGEMASSSTQFNSVLSLSNCLTADYQIWTSSFFVGWSLSWVVLRGHLGGEGGGVEGCSRDGGQWASGNLIVAYLLFFFYFSMLFWNLFFECHWFLLTLTFFWTYSLFRQTVV